MLMIKVILYLNKVRKFKDNFFSTNLPKEIGTKRNKFGIPVLVLDLKTKESYAFVSIAEAARFFNTHPKTIWRIIYNNKLYLNRYQIMEKNNKSGIQYFIVYKHISDYFYYILITIKHNKVFICRTLLFIMLGIIIYIFIYNIFILCINVYDQYIFTMREGRVSYNKCVLEHRLSLNQGLNNTNIIFNNFKPSIIRIKNWRYEYLFKPKLTPLHDPNGELGIYKSIINQINTDFKSTGVFSGINSSYSSPIIERVNINSIFSNAISSMNTHNSIPNSLGIHGVDYSSNINFVVVDNVLINSRLRTTELLNYQSNILYCLINGLSPSIY